MYTVVKFRSPFGYNDLWGLVIGGSEILTVRVLNEDSPNYGKKWQIFKDDIIETRIVDEL